MKKKLKALSLIGGVGSMLLGAKSQGYEIVGSIEWRKYYHNPYDFNNSTFQNYFNAPAYLNYDEAIADNFNFNNINVICGHTECGENSSLRTRFNADRVNCSIEKLRGDTPYMVEVINKIKPDFFAIDNLPRLLEVYPAKDWHKDLPDYDIFFEYISNYNYGNVQKWRRRAFIIGALKKHKYVFVPGEFENNKLLIDVIDDLIDSKEDESFNHMRIKENHIVRSWRNYNLDYRFVNDIQNVTLKKFKKYIKQFGPRKNFLYYNKKGELKKKPGWQIAKLKWPSPVLSGGGSQGTDALYLEGTLNPMTMRERLRVQGAPDDFILYPVDYFQHYQKENFKGYISLMKQTGKFMPVQFTTYLTQQFKDHLLDQPYKNTTNTRFLKQNKYIDQAKKDYCAIAGYSNQKKACDYCGVLDCEKNTQKTKIILKK